LHDESSPIPFKPRNFMQKEFLCLDRFPNLRINAIKRVYLITRYFHLISELFKWSLSLC